MADYNVIFHIDEINKWNLLLKNTSNLVKVLEGEKYNIEVLANSDAVRYYIVNGGIDNDVTTMTKLKNNGVKFVACNNTLISLNLKKENLFDFVEIVPTGVLELVKKQNEGYAYIKP